MKIRKFYFYVFIFAAFSQALFAQSWDLSEEEIGKVDAVFSFVEDDAPGCALGVYKDGKLGYGQGYGLANLDWGIPISTSTNFDIGSVSKQFTAAAVVLLHVEGVLSLEDDVRKWIPELPEYDAPITIRHLLNHTSGIRDYLTLMTMKGLSFDNVFDEFDGVELVVKQQGINFEVGSEFLYSNSGYLLLANIVRRATGKSLRVFLEERFFEPLGMENSSIWDLNTEVVSKRATGYSKVGESWHINHAWNFQMGGDGQVITSVEDLLKWDALFYSPKVGGQALVDQLHTQGVLTNGDTIGYALGLFVDEYRGINRVQHGGSWAGFRAYLARFPEQHTSVALLCNRADVATANLTNQVVDVVLANVLERPNATAQTDASPAPITLSQSELKQWQGLYRRDDPYFLKVELQADKLIASAQGQTFPLIPYSHNEFGFARTGIRVIFSGEGKNRVASVPASGNTYQILETHPVSSDDLKRAIGKYHSAELAVTWELAIDEEDNVSLIRPSLDNTDITFFTPTELSAAGLGLRLEKEGDKVIGLKVFAGRVNNIHFTKNE